MRSAVRARAVSNLLRLLELADEVKTLVEHRQLEMGHARALLGLPQARQQSEVGALVAKKGLSVRETEALVKRMLAHGDKANRKDDGGRPAARPQHHPTRAGPGGQARCEGVAAARDGPARGSS